MPSERWHRRGFDRLYAVGDQVDPVLESLLPPSQADPRVIALRSTAFLTSAVLSRLEATCQRWLSGWPNEVRVLDLGCGRGRLGAHLAGGIGGTVLGVDHSLHALSDAVRAGGPRAAFVQADLTALPLAGESFTLVLAIDVLHLIGDVAAALAEVRRVLAPGGTLIASVYERAGSFGAVRGPDDWRDAIAGVGLELTSWTDVTTEWRAEMYARHERRWNARAQLIERLGAAVAGSYLDVTRQMLGSKEAPGFIGSNRRWELTAGRPRSAAARLGADDLRQLAHGLDR